LSLNDQLQKWLSDPPPEYLFEMTEYALATASSRLPMERRTDVLPERGLAASPSAPNIMKPQLYQDVLSQVKGKHGNSALVIPDYAVRMAVLDFEQFPSGEAERTALLRFRLRKSVPFPIDEARLSYSIQFTNEKLVEVLVVAIARPILEDYERIFLDAGSRLGMVLPSVVATLPLCEVTTRGVTLLAKATGFTLSVVLLEPGRVRLMRCVDLASGEEVAGITQERASSQESAKILLPLLQQTLAYAEDQLGEPVSQVLLSGFEVAQEVLAERIVGDFKIPARPLKSRFGSTTLENAGLLGMLEKYAA
jgi:type IV pilus assembly protein PilM